MVIPRPRGLIAAELKSTQSRQALHTVTALMTATGLQILTPRADVLPYLSNPVPGVYRFQITNFETDATRPLSAVAIRANATPAIIVNVDSFTGASAGFFDVLVTDAAGLLVNLVVDQAFSIGILLRDS